MAIPRLGQVVEQEHRAKLSTPHGLDECAEALMRWVGSLDPTWGQNLKILMDERGLTLRQALGSCLAYVLDHSLHMAVPDNPAFEPAYQVNAVGERECPVCGKLWKPAWRTQPVCSNPCAEAYYAKPTPPVPTVDMVRVQGKPVMVSPEAASEDE